jgi:hypothetical protein
MGQYDIRQFTKDRVMTAEAAAIQAWDNERDRIEKKDQLSVENEQKDKQIANQTMSAEATKQNADTAEYTSLTEFWQGELARARPTDRASMMDAANKVFEERFPGQPTPYSPDIISKERDYGTKHGEFRDILSGKEPQTLDNIDRAIAFYSQDYTNNAPIITQLRAQSEKIKKSDSNKASLSLLSGFITDFMPDNSALVTSIGSLSNQPTVTDAMLTSVASISGKALTATTERMKIQAQAGKLSMEQYKDYADALREIGIKLQDTNPEAGQVYLNESLGILQGLPAMRAGAPKVDPKKGLGFRTPEEVEESYGKEQTSYQDLFKGKMDENTVVNVAGKNMSGTDFLAAEKQGFISKDEVLGASVMDRNLPGGKVEAGKFLQDEKVYDSDGNEYVVSKFKRVIDTDKKAKVAGMGFGVKYKNLLTITKNGKEVDRDISVSTFNEKYSLDKPGKTFKTYKEEKKILSPEEYILSPEEYSVLRAEAEKYAIENLGYTGTETSEELKEKMKKLYDIPKFAVLKQE